VADPQLRVDGTGIWVEFRLAGPKPEWQPESLSLRVLQLLEGATLGKAALSAALGQKKVSGPLNSAIRQLLAEAYVELTVPAKPASRLQQVGIV
jgi:ATP-dependent DNA helicase RecG